MQNREGQRVPDVTFRVRDGHEWKDVTTVDIFAGKKVVVFSLPGAYTPTCSSTHVPRYNHLASEFKKHGIDDIVCISVNDSFVMNAWKRDEKADDLHFVGDGNGEFTEGMGALVEKNDLGFGKRSWRYSMLVNDGVIEKMFIEPEKEGDPFEVSDADTMLKHIAPDAEIPANVAIFTREGCQYCAKAKEQLAKAGHKYQEMILGRDYTEAALRAVSGKATVPQVFIDGKYIGGSEEIEKYLEEK